MILFLFLTLEFFCSHERWCFVNILGQLRAMVNVAILAYSVLQYHLKVIKHTQCNVIIWPLTC